MAEFFDPTDAAFIADPYPTLNALRESGPLHRDADWGLWLVTRHADVKSVQLDRRLGRVQTGHAKPSDFRPIRENPRSDWDAYYQTERHSLLMLEPPEHTRLRGLINRAFTPRRIRELRGPVTIIADDLLANLADRDSYDLLDDFARPFSIQVIAQLLGAPTEQADLLLDWSHAIVKMYELVVSDEQATQAIAASEAFTRWTRRLIQDRRSAPRDDLITALCNARTHEGVLSDGEITSTVILLLNAGHEATVNTIGNGVVAMLRCQAWGSVVDGEVSAATAVEEMLRYDPPLQLFERYALTDDVVIAGTPIPRGDKVAVLFGAANRDPREYDEPDRFQVDRGQATHITFGAGVHHCIGAPLARLELNVALARLAAVFPDIELPTPPTRNEGFVIRGFESVPLVTSPGT